MRKQNFILEGLEIYLIVILIILMVTFINQNSTSIFQQQMIYFI